MSRIRKLITLEWGSEDGDIVDFAQQHLRCASYEVTANYLRLHLVQTEDGSIWEEVGIPLATLRRWFVGDGVASWSLLPPEIRGIGG